MLVRFKVNLGSVDARHHNLDFAKCCEGMICDVPEKTGQWLVAKNIAELAAVRGVAKAAEIAESKPAPLTGRGKQSDKPTPDKEA